LKGESDADRVAFLERGDASTPSPALAGSLRYTADAVAAGSAARADSPEEAVEGGIFGAGPPTTLEGGIFGGCGGACSLGGESGGGVEALASALQAGGSPDERQVGSELMSAVRQAEKYPLDVSCSGGAAAMEAVTEGLLKLAGGRPLPGLT
jgi:hypothetical protein